MLALILLLVVPLLLSAVTLLLRRWPSTASWLAAGSAALLALAVGAVVPGSDDPALQWELLGRLLVLDAATGEILTLLHAGSALLLLLA
ncbi:MAG: hypothetical protein GX579_11870, partial [Chloroflexi bacterium]|nr:hypothetical protein [Chloroflexota bacterium]